MNQVDAIFSSHWFFRQEFVKQSFDGLIWGEYDIIRSQYKTQQNESKKIPRSPSYIHRLQENICL